MSELLQLHLPRISCCWIEDLKGFPNLLQLVCIRPEPLIFLRLTSQMPCMAEVPPTYSLQILSTVISRICLCEIVEVKYCVKGKLLSAWGRGEVGRTSGSTGCFCPSFALVRCHNNGSPWVTGVQRSWPVASLLMRDELLGLSQELTPQVLCELQSTLF